MDLMEKIKNKFDLKKIKTPILIIDKEKIKSNYLRIRKQFKNIKIFYAIKANSHPEILQLLKDLGSGFEVASLNEMNDVLALGVNPKMIISSNTLKCPDFIQEASNKGVDHFAFDSEMEIDKLSKLAPGSKAYLRIIVDDSGSEWPLSKKFGADPKLALRLLQYAKNSKVIPCGITFHVGSQCLDPSSWAKAIKETAQVFQMAEQEGIYLNLINLGGGIPVKYTKNIPEISRIYEEIACTIKNNFKNHNSLELLIEPGRALVGDAAHLVTSVILKAERGGEKWLYLDNGVFNGLMEALQGFKYEIIPVKDILKKEKNKNLTAYTIAGPSCDSGDTIFENYLLNEDLSLEDKLFIKNTGAYTLPYASRFNGFEPPKVYFLE